MSDGWSVGEYLWTLVLLEYPCRFKACLHDVWCPADSLLLHCWKLSDGAKVGLKPIASIFFFFFLEFQELPYYFKSTGLRWVKATKQSRAEHTQPFIGSFIFCEYKASSDWPSWRLKRPQPTSPPEALCSFTQYTAASEWHSLAQPVCVVCFLFFCFFSGCDRSQPRPVLYVASYST